MSAAPDLTDLLTKAKAAFDALTPEQQRLHCQAHHKSWVIGEMMLEHPELSRAEAEKIYDGLEHGT